MLTANDLGTLHLDHDFIEDDLEINFNFAWQTLEFGITESLTELTNDRQVGNEFPLKEAVSASHYRQAASHSLLLEDLSRRSNLFHDAARTYERIDLPYAYNMAAFTDEQHPIKLNRIIWDIKEPQDIRDISVLQTVEVQAQYIYMLLADVDPKFYDSVRNYVPEEKVIELRRLLEVYRPVPVGILGIPVSNYLDLVDAVNPSLFNREVSLETALFPFIAQFDEAIKQTMEDAFHWEQLAFDFHPAEPDIFGVLLRILSILKRRGQQDRLFRFIGNLPLSNPTVVLLRGILADYL